MWFRATNNIKGQVNIYWVHLPMDDHHFFPKKIMNTLVINKNKILNDFLGFNQWANYGCG
jgi:hypothetical protein